MSKYYTSVKRIDGIGSQIQTFIAGLLGYGEDKFIYRGLDFVAHNYDNDPNFVQKLEDLINFKDHFLTFDKIDSESIIDEISAEILYYSLLEPNINSLYNNPLHRKIKNVFWKNKDKSTIFNSNRVDNISEFLNIGVHIRRPNPHDDRINGANTSDEYYIKHINHLKNKYANQNKIFHIYSQGDMKNFYQYLELVENNSLIQFHLNEDVTKTFVEMVACDVYVMSASSFSYAVALLSDGEIYYHPFWHKPHNSWIIL